jgi:S-adenosylmethionine decarboxylase
MGDLYECDCDSRLMVVRRVLREHCLQLVKEAGLTTVGDYFHAFEGGGVTGAVVLSESHMSIHTWPERSYVTIDVYVCNYSDNNREKARTLFEALVRTFAPRVPQTFAIDRA